MNKVSQKIHAKINLTLDVLGSENGFHRLRSLSACIGIYDTVTLYKREDKTVTLIENGLLSGCKAEENNAVKAARAFMDAFGTSGVDVVLNKQIPVGAGLGGSSADVAGVLLGLKRLYGVKGDLLPLAKRLGSDVTFLLYEKPAVMEDKGDALTFLPPLSPLPLVLLLGETGVSTGACFFEYDRKKPLYFPHTRRAEKAYRAKNQKALCRALGNALLFPASRLMPDIRERKTALKKAGASGVSMTGSGSAVFGLFLSEEKAKDAYRALLPAYGERVILTTTV